MDGNQQTLSVASKGNSSPTKRPGSQLPAAALPLMSRIRSALAVERPGGDAVPVPRDRIVLVTLGFPKFSETFIADKFLALADRGWDVHVAALRSDASQWTFFPEIQTRGDLRERLHVSRDLDQTLRSLNPKLIHFEFGSLARDWIHATRPVRAKTIVSFRGFDICHLGLDDSSFYRRVWKEADAIHLVSNSLWKRARVRGCPPNKPFFIINDAADEDFFTNDQRVYREGLGTAERPLRILSVGRLVWQKGYEYAIQAVNRLASEGISLEYRIIGDGDQRSAVLYTAHDLGIEHSVKLLGALPKKAVKGEMLQADVFLLASVTEGFGVSVIEAQATGLPVVCSDADGLVENVADGVTGFVVARRDPEALATKLKVLTRDRALRQRLGEAGRERAGAKFRLQNQLQQIEQMYRQVVDVRYQARQMSQELLAEDPPNYPRDEQQVWQQEATFSEP